MWDVFVFEPLGLEFLQAWGVASVCVFAHAFASACAFAVAFDCASASAFVVAFAFAVDADDNELVFPSDS